MTDENKVVEVKQECFCQSKWFKNFLTTAVGTFVGVFCALSLFAALHKPPVPPCPFAKGPMMRPAMHCHHHYAKFDRGHRGHFYKKFEKQNFDKKPPVRVEVKD